MAYLVHVDEEGNFELWVKDGKDPHRFILELSLRNGTEPSKFIYEELKMDENYLGYEYLRMGRYDYNIKGDPSEGAIEDYVYVALNTKADEVWLCYRKKGNHVYHCMQMEDKLSFKMLQELMSDEIYNPEFQNWEVPNFLDRIVSLYYSRRRRKNNDKKS